MAYQFRLAKTRCPQQYGFILDTERGYWARKEDDQTTLEADDPMSPDDAGGSFCRGSQELFTLSSRMKD